MRDIWDTIKFIIIAPFSIIMFLFEAAVEWILKRLFNYIPEWAKTPIYPHQDVFVYYDRDSENHLSHLDIYPSSNDEEDKYTYPIAKDFIEQTSSPYTLLVKIHAHNEFIEIYRCFLETYSEERKESDPV